MTKRIEEKLKKLGVNKSNQTTEEKDFCLKNINTIEGIKELKLPDTYKYLLSHYNEISFDDILSIKSIVESPLSSKGMEDVIEIYTSELVLDAEETYSHRMPYRLLPIGDSHGGDLICLDLDEDKVYYWHHEDEYYGHVFSEGSIDEINNYWDNLYLISNSFEDFILNLEVEDSNLEEDSRVGEIIWHDEDTRKSLIEFSERKRRERGED